MSMTAMEAIEKRRTIRQYEPDYEIPNPQSPIPNPQSPFFIYINKKIKLFNHFKH